MGELDRERNVSSAPSKREFAGHTKSEYSAFEKKTIKTDTTKTSQAFKSYCPHCGFYGHPEAKCKIKQAGKPEATEAERAKRKIFCSHCRIVGNHDTKDCNKATKANVARSDTPPPSIYKKSVSLDTTNKELCLSARHREVVIKHGLFGKLKGGLQSVITKAIGKVSDIGSKVASSLHNKIITECAFLTTEERAAYSCSQFRQSKDLPHWLFDSGATAHMTPHLEDLENVQPCDVIITLADGSEVRCKHAGECAIDMVDDDGDERKLKMGRVLYVPGLDRRLLSVPYFCKTRGNSMNFTCDDIEMTFAGFITKTFPAIVPNRDYANAAIINSEQDRIEDTRANQTLRPVDSDLLHLRLGHRGTNAILTASKHRLWRDVIAVAGADPFCTSCRIAVQPKSPRSKTPMPIPPKPSDWVSFDVEANPAPSKLILEDYFPNILIGVDIHSRKSTLIGLKGETSKDIIAGMQEYIAKNWRMKKISSDAGNNFLSEQVNQWLIKNEIAYDASPPEGQHTNGFTERHWQTIGQMARKMLVHARLSNDFAYHALQYAS
ncbi:MAG: hypothetical protein ACREOZ_03225, partial [Gloeomargaritales cyanobacterium]